MEDKKHYLTEKGVEEVKKRLEDLEEQRIEIIRKQAPQPLDYREADADYVSYQEKLGRLESRIRELKRSLDNYELIKVPPEEERKIVHLGATVVVDMEGVIEEFTIVGTLESDPANQKISDRSPLGKALLNKRVGEEVKIKTAIVDQTCRIIKIKYEGL